MLVRFRRPDGETVDIDGTEGISIMEVARANDIPGILADCGGACACATCHIYVDPDWLDRLDARSSVETDLLECVDDPRPNSRLSCQLKLTADLNGIEVEIPTE